MRWLAPIALPLLLVACAGRAPEDEGPVGQHDQELSAFETWLVIDGQSTLVEVAPSTNKSSGELTLRIPGAMAQPLRDWIEATLGTSHERKSGEIQGADAKGTVHRVAEFHRARITELGFPALDTSSKAPGSLLLKLGPELTRYRKGDGRSVDGPNNARQKMWHPTDFRVKIDGLEACADKITKVGPLTIKPGQAEVPALKIAVVGSECAGALTKWRSESEGGAPTYRAGSLAFLSPHLGKELITIQLPKLGVLEVKPGPTYTFADLFVFEWGKSYDFGDEPDAGR